MTFKEGKEQEFLAIFNENKDRIRNFDGCSHLDLLQDTTQPNVFSTYSHWESEAALDAYRHSELFSEVWAETKKLFSAKPIAHSYSPR